MADDISTTCNINYESKTQAIDSNFSRFSIRFRVVKRSLFRSPNGRETLLQQRTLHQSENATIVSNIPPNFLAGEETCKTYVADVLSKAKLNSWIKQRIVPRICRDMINMGLEESFLVEAEVEIVKEISLSNYFSINDYDSQGRLLPIEQDCVICLEELSLGGERKIMKLRCSHNFHRDCLLTWLQRKHSCPTCRDDIQNPRPKKEVVRTIPFE